MAYISKVRRLPEGTARLLRTLIVVDVEQPFVDVRVVVPDHLQVTPEGRVISDVEADDGRIPGAESASLSAFTVPKSTHSLMSASVRCFPKMNGPSPSARIFSIRSRLSKSSVTFSSYASCVAAKPDYTTSKSALHHPHEKCRNPPYKPHY